eukprot:2033149-Pyramimonas_sp.AAC.1
MSIPKPKRVSGTPPAVWTVSAHSRAAAGAPVFGVDRLRCRTGAAARLRTAIPHATNQVR